MLLAISDVVLEIVMNKVGSSKCMAKGIFTEKNLEEWNDIDKEFLKEFTRRS
jgi:hypothetical protein